MNAYATDFGISPLAETSSTRSVVSQEESKMLEISSKFLEKTSTEKMRAIVQLAAQPIIAGEGKMRRIERAAARLGIGIRRARSHWYGEARQVNADEFETAKLRAAELAARLFVRLAALEHIDADLYRHEIDALRNTLGRAGFVDRTRTGTGKDA